MEIYTATISHKHGINLYHGKSEKSLRAQIYGYVEDYWKDEFGDDPIPSNEDKAIEQYFESASNRGECIDYFDPVKLDTIQ